MGTSSNEIAEAAFSSIKAGIISIANEEDPIKYVEDDDEYDRKGYPIGMRVSIVFDEYVDDELMDIPNDSVANKVAKRLSKDKDIQEAKDKWFKHPGVIKAISADKGRWLVN